MWAKLNTLTPAKKTTLGVKPKKENLLKKILPMLDLKDIRNKGALNALDATKQQKSRNKAQQSYQGSEGYLLE